MIILGLGLGITFQQVGNNCLSLDDAKREVEVSGVFFRGVFFFWRIIKNVFEGPRTAQMGQILL